MTTYSHNITYFLYIKQCSHCGLKYFGYTKRKDPFKYLGSGTRWRRHLNMHGKNNMRTLDIFGFDDHETCQEFAIIFSLENNIAEDRNVWANLKDETCDNGGCLCDESLFKMINSLTGKKRSEESKQRQRDTCKRNPRSVESRLITSLQHKGKTLSEETKRKMRKPKSQESRINYRMSKLGPNHPRYDRTIREWHHPEHGTFIGTNVDLRMKYSEYNIHTSNLSAVVKSWQTHHKGWRLK